ncbi:unnamed protein product [Paramecium octaurelia]|uniref:Uncharacterized protein n=1 Tax=Paramecium octaurelia TaxID=43137 RepID=A0A8S1TDL3_PAROT|nr:unnamed protein product [Paramecium octaurelia]
MAILVYSLDNSFLWLLSQSSINFYDQTNCLYKRTFFEIGSSISVCRQLRQLQIVKFQLLQKSKHLLKKKQNQNKCIEKIKFKWIRQDYLFMEFNQIYLDYKIRSSRLNGPGYCYFHSMANKWCLSVMIKQSYFGLPQNQIIIQQLTNTNTMVYCPFKSIMELYFGIQLSLHEFHQSLITIICQVQDYERMVCYVTLCNKIGIRIRKINEQASKLRRKITLKIFRFHKGWFKYMMKTLYYILTLK